MISLSIYFRLGKGEFVAKDHLGNFEINDTVLQIVDLTEYNIISGNHCTQTQSKYTLFDARRY